MALNVMEPQGALQIPEALLAWLSPDAEEVRADEAEFDRLADQWHRETEFTSATDEIVCHPGYRRIIAMGEPAVPWILRDLRSNGGDWFDALEAITGESPVAGEDVGYPRRMKAAWFEWGKAHGYEA